ncbi:MAG: N-acetyl-gamma-glutamyl-phosphate reductase [Thermoanaerobacterales bacterium 50_218]|nr:MAG: N-acetyl-gamma-glutamyl-phosphate reductase [Thermoanaerobacterales bacterium 50_218]HAA88973.1 N-acetyl-gamma-glutamyl-phosphate reductase [Peptococcaceae bacterium]
MGIKVGIVGATGYVGEELIRILCQHPEVEEIFAVSRDFPGTPIDRVFPHLRGYVHLEILDFEAAPTLAEKTDVVFFALPHGISSSLVPKIFNKGKKVIDLAADFRVPDLAIYEKWYQVPHGAPDLLPEAVYGLPELFRSSIPAARLIANPGCYPTGALLALAPLLKHGLIRPDSVIIDSKSGVSGAGRSLNLGTHYPECNENVRAYSVAAHRHMSEISYYASRLAGREVGLTFVPHLIPMTRGILSTVYAELARPLDAASVRQIFKEFYEGEVFIHITEEGEWPQTKWVQGTNQCFLGVTVSNKKQVIVVSVIDNLVKGAAGQAVQNMNLLFGFPETAGLATPGLYP